MLARTSRMRFAMVVVLVVGACADEGSSPQDDGACAELSDIECRAENSCQLAFTDSGFQPAPNPECKRAITPATTADACPTAESDCRARPECSPLYWQELGPNDGPVGPPQYRRCAPELELFDLYANQEACGQLGEVACRESAQCQALYTRTVPTATFTRCMVLIETAVSVTEPCSNFAGQAGHFSCRTQPHCVAMYDERADGPMFGNCVAEADIVIE